MEELCNHLAEDGKADEAYVQTILASFDAKGKDLENQLQNEVLPVPYLISAYLLHFVPASFLLYIIVYLLSFLRLPLPISPSYFSDRSLCCANSYPLCLFVSLSLLSPSQARPAVGGP
jgi:hypothetical protein